MLINFNNCLELIKICHGKQINKVLHIGAHVGEEVKTYSENNVKELIWFEANEALIPELLSNINKYNIKQQVIPIALWNENTDLIFKITNNFQSSSFYDFEKHSEYYPSINVVSEQNLKVFRYDYLIDKIEFQFTDFNFINIDTQGSELSILKGMGDHLKQEALYGIYLEVNNEKLYKDIPLVNEIDDFLRLNNFHRIITKWTNAGWGDAFYLKSNDDIPQTT